MTAVPPAAPSLAAPSLADALDRLKAIVGPKGWLDQAADQAPFLAEWRGRFVGRTPIVLRPASTEEVAACVAVCAEAGLPLVPQGGNTSLVGGSIPFEDGREIVLSLGRMNRIRLIDPLDYTVTAEAGCTVAALQEAAEQADRLFPLSFGAEGTAQIGGAISTNAGGILTLRYGNTRDLVLGLEVVLADGRVWHGLRRLRKDNTGYDLKQLFIGAEGTLGIITAAVLKLMPRPRQVETAFLAIPDPAAAIAVLARLREATGDAVKAFELIPRLGLEFACRHITGVTDPLDQAYPWYALVEIASGTSDERFRSLFETVLEELFEQELVTDAALAASQAQAQAFWLIREGLVEAQKFEGASLKNDVSVPVSRVPEFIQRATQAVAERIPGIRPVPFGHVGDGNIHFNLNQPEGADPALILARWDEIQALVNQIVLDLEGSISAEHGVGRIKIQELTRMKTPLEVELMQRLRASFDPHQLLNPGKLLP